MKAGIDSQTPVELLFDLGLGDAYVVRVPGVAVGTRSLGGIEYAISFGGARLVVVLAHVDQDLLALAIRNACSPESLAQIAGCEHLEEVLERIADSIDRSQATQFDQWTDELQQRFLRDLTLKHISKTVQQLIQDSAAIERWIRDGNIQVVGAIYEPKTGVVEFLNTGNINHISTSELKGIR